jgi:hypothetical protein
VGVDVHVDEEVAEEFGKQNDGLKVDNSCHSGTNV